MIAIGETLCRKVLISEAECADILTLLSLEIIGTRHDLANTNDSVMKRVYMRRLKHYGAVADRIKFANKERVEV